MTNNSPVGILDSGVGGLSVWQEIAKHLPQEQTLYVADSANAPYGTKSEEEIFRLASRVIEFLLTKQVKLIVAACNTITVSCIDRLRQAYPQIEIVGVVPAIKTAVALSKRKKIGVLTTERTAKSSYQHDLIKKFARKCEVITVGTNKLVPLIERGEEGQIREALPTILKPFTERDIDVVVLGCTHYPLIAAFLQVEMGREVLLVDSGEAIARRVEVLLTKHKLKSKQKTAESRFFTTGSVEKADLILSRLA